MGVIGNSPGQGNAALGYVTVTKCSPEGEDLEVIH